MNDYERACREHPAQWHKDQRTLAAIEANYHKTAPEPQRPKRPKRPKRVVRPSRARFAMMWRY